MLVPEYPDDHLEGLRFTDGVPFTSTGVVPLADHWQSIPVYELPSSIAFLEDLVAGWASYKYWVGVGNSRVVIARRDGSPAFDPIDARGIASHFLGFESTVSLVMPGFGRTHYLGYWSVEISPDQNLAFDAYIC